MPLLLLDFDGTVCLGDGPVWAYAEAVVDVVRQHLQWASEADSIAENMRAELAAFLNGSGEGPRYPDGYAAVAALAAGQLTQGELHAAYAASRRTLAGGDITVTAPEGLADLLGELGGQVTRIVITNAPDEGVRTTLDQIGLGGVIDEVVTGVGKPSGWNGLLRTLLQGRSPVDVMAVGDIWVNDLQPPLEAGCCTALIDRFDRRPGPAHLIASRFEDLYDGIRRWAADPGDFAATHRAVIAAAVSPAVPAPNAPFIPSS